MAEQETEDGISEDDWAAAMQEQAAVDEAMAAAPAAQPATGLFPSFDSTPTGPATMNDFDLILDIPVQITVELGRTKISIRNLLQLAHGSVVELDALAGEPEQRSIFRYAAGGFRDFTRIAGSDPTMWRDIALANGPALVAALDRVTAHVGTLRAAIEDGDGEKLMASFTRARQAREEFAEELRSRTQGNSGSE